MVQTRALLILRERMTIGDHELCHSARWQVSEQLSAFLGTLLKPLSAFERKAITNMYPRPDVDWVYTPSLDNYLPSLLPGVKTVDKDNIFCRFVC